MKLVKKLPLRDEVMERAEHRRRESASQEGLQADQVNQVEHLVGQGLALGTCQAARSQ